MKIIQLTQGQVALVDDEDYERINKHKWYAYVGVNTFYARRTSGGEKIIMHREIMGCTKGDEKIIDHINHNGLDCQQHNMRLVTKAQNAMNRISFGKSIYLGVCLYNPKRYIPKSTRWVASIHIKNKRINLGYFKEEIQAAQAYNEAAKKYYGEYANLNIIQ